MSIELIKIQNIRFLSEQELTSHVIQITEAAWLKLTNRVKPDGRTRC